mmetsp:Transcript_6432/g.11853  ORF Transcript_6432/g.11853 Transcript_6432/m.11853 type:complete len:82 (-) Transcript_6432:38-283(-)
MQVWHSPIAPSEKNLEKGGTFDRHSVSVAFGIISKSKDEEKREAGQQAQQQLKNHRNRPRNRGANSEQHGYEDAIKKLAIS